MTTPAGFTRIGPDDPQDLKAMASAPAPGSAPVMNDTGSAGTSEPAAANPDPSPPPNASRPAPPPVPATPASNNLMSAAAQRNFMMEAPNASFAAMYREHHMYSLQRNRAVNAILHSLQRVPISPLERS